MNLRKRQPEDCPAVVRLLAAVDLPADGLDRTEGWVIEEGQDILGHVAVELTPEVAVIRSVVVAPRAQGRGLARQLMDEAEAQGDCRVLALRTESIGAWVERRGYVRTTVAQLPPSVRTTTQFEGELCSSYPVYAKAAPGEAAALAPETAKVPATNPLEAGPKPKGCGCGCR